MDKFSGVDFKIIGERIFAARKALDLTQEQAAERANITAQFWSRIESGNERGSVNTYLEIASVLGLTLDDMFYDNATRLRLLKALSKDELVAGCSASERAIISESLLALRDILVNNRSRYWDHN